MGCGASTDVPRTKIRANEDPELMGKAKFLSCPSISEATDVTGTKWLIMVFAPLTYHGLVFVARNYQTGALLVKDIPDKQVAKEKEDQKVQLSYNLFFKAISTEVGKANRTGAKVEWLDNGTVTVECKISISGSSTANKKTDTYLVVLEPVEPTEENLFRYVLEPIATHYIKKRSDGWNLDRPDPHKEKIYGEQESNAIMRAASIQVSQRVLDTEVPVISGLRQEYNKLRAERDSAVSRVNLLKQMLVYQTRNPPLLSLPHDDVFAPCPPTTAEGINVLQATQEPHLVYPTSADALHESPFVQRQRQALSTAPPLPPSYEITLNSPLGGFDYPLQTVGLSSFVQLGLVGTEPGQFAESNLNTFLFRMDCGHRRTNPFHNVVRAADRLRAMHLLLQALLRAEVFKPSKEALGAAMIAAVIHDADHTGLNNHHMMSMRSPYLSTLYNLESPVECHSLAVGYAETIACALAVNVDAVASCVLSTDLSRHQDFALRFARRVKEVADFSRRFDDQMLVLTALLKVSDLSHLYSTSEECRQALRDLASEQGVAAEIMGHSGGDASGAAATTDVELFVTHVARPFFGTCVAAFPQLDFIAIGCDANFPSRP